MRILVVLLDMFYVLISYVLLLVRIVLSLFVVVWCICICICIRVFFLCGSIVLLEFSVCVVKSCGERYLLSFSMC